MVGKKHAKAIQIQVPVLDQEFAEKNMSKLLGHLGFSNHPIVGVNHFEPRSIFLGFLLDHLSTLQLVQHCKNN